jgi:hypothetical protein
VLAPFRLDAQKNRNCLVVANPFAEVRRSQPANECEGMKDSPDHLLAFSNVYSDATCKQPIKVYAA